jgi:hypothetical protein
MESRFSSFGFLRRTNNNDRGLSTGLPVEPVAPLVTSIGKKRELLSHWQRVCKLILAKEDVLTVSRALELALFYDAKLDVSKVPAK